MDRERELLEELIRRSRDWTQVDTKEDLFRAASRLLREVFDVDAGYFVYQTGNSLLPLTESLTVHEPWGAFVERVSEVQARVAQQATAPGALDRVEDRWYGLDNVPEQVRGDWTRWGVRQGGSWVLTLRGTRVGLMVLRRSVELPDDSNLMRLCALQISLVLELLTMRCIAEDLSRRDILTGIWNRRGVLEHLPAMLADARRAGQYVLLGMLDVDDFKYVNDSRGHPAGDQLLVEI